MATSLKGAKHSLNLATPGLGKSRIRREPPPPVKEVSAADTKQRETLMVIVGILGFALALTVILMGLSVASGWSPTKVTIRL